MNAQNQRASAARRLVAGSVLIFVLVVLRPSGSAAAQGDGPLLTVSAAVCPIGYEGDRFAEDCSGNPGAGLWFEVRVPGDPSTIDPAVATDADGFVTFDISGFLPGTVRIVGGVPYRTLAVA